MTIDVFAADEQQAHPMDVARWAELARQVLAARGIKGETEVSLLFVDEEAIASLNEKFLGKSGPTDVLSFPIEDEPGPTGRSPDLGGSGPGTSPEEGVLSLLGDVVICPSRGQPQRGRRTTSASMTRWHCWSSTACSTCSGWTTRRKPRPSAWRPSSSNCCSASTG